MSAVSGSVRRIAAYGNRPLAVIGASRGNGPANTGYMRSAREAGNTQVIGAIWETDHPFSDKRISAGESAGRVAQRDRAAWYDGCNNARSPFPLQTLFQSRARAWSMARLPSVTAPVQL